MILSINILTLYIKKGGWRIVLRASIIYDIMKNYNFENLRNVGLIGHGATGKTSLAEALLYYTGTTDRLGKNEDGTTVMDYEVEEKKRGISL